MLEDKFVLEDLLPELVKLRQENQALKSSININRKPYLGNNNPGEHQDSRGILENVDPLYSVDPEWRLTYVNSKSAQMWKRKPEELVGELIWNLFPHQEHTQSYQELHRAMRERIPTRFETFSPDLLIWTETNIYPTTNGGLSVYFADISQRKQAEEQLRLSEQEKSTILESITDAFFTFNHDWQVKYWNKAAENMFRLKKDEVLGRNIWDIIPGAVGSRFYQQYHRAMNENQPVAFEAFGGHTGYWVEARAFPSPDGLSVYLRDITERKLAEEALLRSHEELEAIISERTAELKESNTNLRSSEERFKIALANSQIFVFNQDKDLRYTWVHNPIPGFSVDELLGRTDKELFPFDDHSQFIEIKRSVLKTGISLEEEVRTTFKGKTFLCDLSVYPVRDSAGEVTGISCVLTDITRQRQMETDIARLDRLGLVGEMAASIGHEIRNPMTVVRGFIQLLTEQQCYQKDRLYLDLMLEELDRANGIISEYLGMARDKIINLRSQSLDQVVTAIYPMLEADANFRGMSINLDLGKSPVPLIDENEIRQLLLNMARNGLEAMSPGGILTIGTMAEGSEIILFIKDKGHGLAPELIDRLGTPFVTTKETGTGLGLAVCYSIAARHNAKITFESGQEGTTFYICFPLPVEQK